MSQIPDINSSWGTIATFALTFNGYGFAGGLTQLSDLYNKVALNPENASLDELRACLFFLQRAGRFCGDEGCSGDLEQAHVLLKLMHIKYEGLN